MTRITNSEQVLALLRSHLERAQRANRKDRAKTREARPGALARIKQLSAVEGLSEADIARALIAGLLSVEFGPEAAVEPRFQSMVEEVRLMIDRDETGRALLRRAISELTASA